MIIFAVVAVIGLNKNESTTEDKEQTTTATDTKNASDTVTLFNLGGVTLAPYNETTGTAGDIKFSKNSLDAASGKESLVFLFGQKLPKNSGDTVQRINPNFEFGGLDRPIDLVAAIDGIVAHIEQQQESNDYEVFLSPKENSDWVVGYDHVTNLTVKKGEAVKVGQKLGVAGKQNSGDYRYELQINNNNTDTMHCPTALLDSSVKATYAAALTQLVTDWQTWYGKSTYPTLTEGCTAPSITAAVSEGR